MYYIKATHFEWECKVKFGIRYLESRKPKISYVQKENQSNHPSLQEMKKTGDVVTSSKKG